jgi:hypothetical protein
VFWAEGEGEMKTSELYAMMLMIAGMFVVWGGVLLLAVTSIWG